MNSNTSDEIIAALSKLMDPGMDVFDYLLTFRESGDDPGFESGYESEELDERRAAITGKESDGDYENGIFIELMKRNESIKYGHKVHVRLRIEKATPPKQYDLYLVLGEYMDVIICLIQEKDKPKKWVQLLKRITPEHVERKRRNTWTRRRHILASRGKALGKTRKQHRRQSRRFR